MKVLVWQWGRFGAGPRFAACLADALRGRPGIEVALSLSRDAEIMGGTSRCGADVVPGTPVHKAQHDGGTAETAPPRCEMPVRTYQGTVSFLMRVITAPVALPLLWLRLRRIMPDLAICAMPGPLDLLMAVALRLLGTRLLVVVHDADAHQGDGFPMQMVLQRRLCRMAGALVVLSGHVGGRLRAQGLAGHDRTPLIPFSHPPFGFELPVAQRADGPPRLLCFGRLLPYKGLDLLAAALASLPPLTRIEVRVVGCGPESQALDALRSCHGVTVENRWVPENEIGSLLAWSDGVILPYREASQSGVAAAALAAGRPVIATRVGGLREQLAAAPQVVLCEPTADSIARAIALWLETPRQIAPAADADEVWRTAVTGLLQAIATTLPLKTRPRQQQVADAGMAGAPGGRPSAGAVMRRQ